MSASLDIQLIAAVTAGACALLGVFLLLRGMALLSDAISHAILLGIVLGFLLVQNLSSPLLVVGAATSGVLTVLLVELLQRTGLVREDAAIGLVFPALFSIGVVLITRHAGDVHLDSDAVLLGKLAFAPLRRAILFERDFGPQSLLVMTAIFLLNLVFITLFYKELKLATFDAGLAATLGLAPGVLHYALVSLVSVTAVGAFSAVGSVLVVALMIAPPATAYLLTNRLSVMLFLSVALGALSGIAGYWWSRWLDASIPGAMAVTAGALFGLAYLFAPEQGVVYRLMRRQRQRQEVAQLLLLIHLLNHEHKPEAMAESRIVDLHRHLGWQPDYVLAVVGQAERRELVRAANGILLLTDSGRELAREAMTE